MHAPRKRFRTVDEYIQDFPAAVQAVLQRIRQTIREAAPDAVEMISYQIPTFKQDGNYLIYFAAYKNHIGVYPVPRGSEELERELSPYVRGKGTLRFPLDQPFPYDLVSKIVEFRLGEHQRE